MPRATFDDATLRALEWEAVCQQVAGHTNAPIAHRELSTWRPFGNLEEAREALVEVAEAMDLIGAEAALPAPYVEDQSRAIRVTAVEGAALDGPELLSAARTLESVRKLSAFLRRGAKWLRLADRFRNAPSLPQLERRILDAFDTEAHLVDHASAELGQLRGDVRRHRATLIDSLSRLIAGLPHILVAADSRPTLREGRYVVPLRREALSEVPGIVHDESASGATIYLEPREAIERNNALRHAELAVRREEERIMRELTAELADRRVELEHAARLALHMETVLARARYALSVAGHPPTLGGVAIRLRSARHPLLVARVEQPDTVGVGRGHVVPLDLDLEEAERALVVTGPNTGGKTVLLKSVGIVTLMAQAGIVPPVGPGTDLPWHDAVIADIGDTQSIAEDLSTFTAHLARLKAATEAAAEATLILVDEIGASTDPAEGAALAAALLESWVARGARAIVTTHYHALKALAGSTPGLVNGSLAYDVERNLPQYRFIKGVPGRSFGLELALRWGLEPEILSRAHDRLDHGLRDLDELTRRLAAEERSLVETRQALEAERRAIGDAESARARRIVDEASARREAAEQRLSELEGQLARLRDEVRALQRKLRERTAALAEAEAAARSAQVLSEEANRAAAALRAEREALAAERPAPEVAVGDTVRIPRYQVEGELVEIDRLGDACAVRVGQVRIACRVSELELVASAAERQPAKTPAIVESVDLEPVDLTLEIDLRGMTADEVAFPVAGAVERAYHTGRSTIRVIHGKGAGILRSRVKELLEKHPYVREFRLGQWNEGGDGVTIAILALDQDS
jgi:DNA mismatch repair protein MutS2